MSRRQAKRLGPAASKSEAPRRLSVTRIIEGSRSTVRRAGRWTLEGHLLPSEAGKRLALVGCSTLVGFLLLEMVVRLIEPREVIREFFERPDPVLHHKFIPGARGRQKTTEFDAGYVINSLGLRDKEISREKPAGTRRILMLGDSFTEGNGVDETETFSSRLQAKLNEAGFGKRWLVI